MLRYKNTYQQKVTLARRIAVFFNSMLRIAR